MIIIIVLQIRRSRILSNASHLRLLSKSIKIYDKNMRFYYRIVLNFEWLVKNDHENYNIKIKVKRKKLYKTAIRNHKKLNQNKKCKKYRGGNDDKNDITEPAIEPVAEPVKEPAPESSKEPAPESSKEPAPESSKEKRIKTKYHWYLTNC